MMSAEGARVGPVCAPVEVGGSGGGVSRGGETLDRLRKLLDGHRLRSGSGRSRGGCVPTGIGALDDALPQGGLPTGAVIEVLSGGLGIGAWTLAFRIAYREMPPVAMRPVVVVDCDGDFYPPAAVALGAPADRLLVVRARRQADAFWAADQALRCRAVGAVVATRLLLDGACSRRLQLAAEESGGVGLIVAPASARRHTFAEVQLLVEPVLLEHRGGVAWSRLRGHEEVGSRHADVKHAHASVGMAPEGSAASWHLCPTLINSGVARWFRITVLKLRGLKPAEPIIVGFPDESLDVPAHSVPADRASSDRHRRSA